MNPRAFASRNPTAVAAIVFTAFAFALYGTSISGGFLLDDWWWAAAAKRRGPLGLYEGWRQMGLFVRPVVSIVFSLLWKLFGPNASGYRVFNVLLQVVTALALRGIWFRLTLLKDQWIALGVGVVFLAWPTHPETVVWIAGMTDGLALCFGVLGIWTLLISIRESKPGMSVLSMALFALAMLSKESAIVLPMVGAVLSPIVARRQRLKQFLVSLSSMTLLVAGYLAFRHEALGTFVGGYHNETGLRGFVAGAFGNKMVTNLSNAYLPFAKYVFLTGGFDWVTLQLGVLLVGAAALAIRSVPRAPRASDHLPYAISIWLTILGALWAGVQSSQSVQAVLLAIRAAPVAIPFAASLALYAIWRARAPISRLADALSSGTGLTAFHLAAGFVTLWLARRLEGQVERFILEGLFLALVFVTRPCTATTELSSEKVRLLAISIACFAASFLCLLPTANLPVGIDGQQARFSYLATFFSVPALSALLCLLFKDRGARRELMGVALAGVTLLFFLWLGPWTQSARLWASASQAIDRLSPARRIYVLVAPGMVGHAVGFLGGLEDIPYVTRGDSSTHVLTVWQVWHFLPPDRIQASREAPNRFKVAVLNAPIRHFTATALQLNEGATSLLRRPPVWGAHTAEFEAWIELKDLQPADHVIAITDSGAFELR